MKKRDWLFIPPALFIGFYFGYIGLALFTDLRIDDIRPFIQRGAIETGVEAGIKKYKEEFVKDEALHSRKRKERDRIIKRYIKEIDSLMVQE